MSEAAPLAAQALLIGVARASPACVAVGQFGNVVVSRDQGRTWQQIIVPTRSMLTGVSFPDARHGWAVGHDGVILATTDGGQTWSRQDDGTDDQTIYLDVLFLDKQTGFAVGAYGKFVATEDGGKTWTARPPIDEDLHFNRLTANATGSLFLAGESGTALTSADQGHTWQRLDVPYEGSLYGLLPVDGSRLLAYGLRSHIFRSDDAGTSWQPLESDPKVLIMAGLRLSSGAIALAGQGGHFFVSRDGGRSFRHWTPDKLNKSVSSLAETDDGALIAVGEGGALRLELPPE